MFFLSEIDHFAGFFEGAFERLTAIYLKHSNSLGG